MPAVAAGFPVSPGGILGYGVGVTAGSTWQTRVDLADTAPQRAGGGIMCFDRIISIFCATGWLMFGPLPGSDEVRNGVPETPAAAYTAPVTGEGDATGGGRDDEVVGGDDPAVAAGATTTAR